MNATQVVTRALNIEQETIDDFYSTAELYSWLDDGLLEFINLSGIKKAIFSITTVVSQADYSYPSGLIRPEKVWFGSDYDELESTDVRTLSSIYPGWKGESGGEPTYYYEELPGYISVYPKPDSSYAGKTIRVLGISEHDAVSATSAVLAIPSIYHPSLVEFLLYRMKLKDERQKEAGVHYALFLRTAQKANVDARQANRKDRRFSMFPAKILKT